VTPKLAAGQLLIDTMLGATLNAAKRSGGLAATSCSGQERGDRLTAARACSTMDLEVMGGGSILVGLCGAIGVLVIERDFLKAYGLCPGRCGAALFGLDGRPSAPAADGVNPPSRWPSGHGGGIWVFFVLGGQRASATLRAHQ